MYTANLVLLNHLRKKKTKNHFFFYARYIMKNKKISQKGSYNFEQVRICKRVEHIKVGNFFLSVN